MTNTIELQCRTTYHADEPDRSKKYTNHALQQDEKDAPLHFVEGRGWTWGVCARHYTWEEFLARFKCYFPLREVTRTTKFKRDRLVVEDGPSHKNIDIRTWDGLKQLCFYLGEGRSIRFSPEQAAQLRDFLNANVITTEA